MTTEFTPEKVAEMTSTCDMDYHAPAKPELRWTARKWCNPIGESVIGHGPTAWAAVQAAYQLHAIHYPNEQ